MKKKKIRVAIATIMGAIVITGAYAKNQKEPEMLTYDYEITRVIDGDTVEFAAPFLPAPLKPRLAIRIFGVDTPEKGARAQCQKEALAASAATAYTQRMITNSKRVQVAIADWDKYGGRVLGDIILNGDTSLRRLLIEEGYAREYWGGPKQGWCDPPPSKQ